jgi:hypothetical protein
MNLGEPNTEQFTVTTRVNGELIKAQPIHDPFIRTTTKMRGLRHAWNALTRGIEVTVAVDASHGAMLAIMTLDPRQLEDDTQLFLEQQAQRRTANDAAGLVGYCAEQKGLPMNPLNRLSAGILAAVVYLSSLPLIAVVSCGAMIPVTACSSQDAKSFADAFIASAQAVVDADPSASYVPDLNIAIAAMKTAEAGWDGSSINCALTSAANITANILDSILPGSPVALIATIAVAGFDVLAAKLFPCTTPPALAPAIAGEPHSSLRASSHAYAGYKASIGHALFPEHTYRKAFNQAAKDSGLTVRI